jgi:Cu/Ag efflux protein CusF
MNDSTSTQPTTNISNEETQELSTANKNKETVKSESVASDLLTLTVKNQANQTMLFKVKKSTEFKKIFAAYSERVSVPVRELRFLIDGEAISEHQTPDMISYEEDDEIDVMYHQVGGVEETEDDETQMDGIGEEQVNEEKENSDPTPASLSASLSAPLSTPPPHSPHCPPKPVIAAMNLSVKDQTTGQTIVFKIKKDTLLSKVFEHFAKQRGYSLNLIRFMYNGRRLQGNVTPKMLEMEDGDEVDATVEQVGGK